MAGTADTIVKEIANIEPTVATVVGMFVPGAAPVLAAIQPWAPLALTYLDRTLSDLAAGNGGDIGAAFIELLQHITKGQPNSPILSAPAP